MVDHTRVNIVTENDLVYNIFQRGKTNDLGMKIQERPTFVLNTEVDNVQTNNPD